MFDSGAIVSLYTKYGFEVEDETHPSLYLAFSHSSGYFQNAEILLIDPEFDCETLEKEYKDAGFSVKVSKFLGIKQLHERLFDGFFAPESNYRSLRREYDRYTKKQTEKI